MNAASNSSFLTKNPRYYVFVKIKEEEKYHSIVLMSIEIENAKYVLYKINPFFP